MYTKAPLYRRICLAFCAMLALGACVGTQIEDDATEADQSSTVTPNSSTETSADPRDIETEEPLEVEPLVHYAHLSIDSSGRIRCESSLERDEGWVVEYTINDETGPYNENHVCVRALTDADQDTVRDGQELAAKISTYLEKDLPVDTSALETQVKKLEEALASDWDSVEKLSTQAASEFKDTRDAVKAKKVEEEAKREAEAKRRAEEEARQNRPSPKPEPKPSNSQSNPKPSESTPKPKPKPEAPAQPGATSITAAVLSITNGYRANAGANALKADSCAEKWAMSHSVAQAKKSSMFHQDLGPVMSACGGTGAAENVAYGQGSASAVAQAWFNSLGHKANMLNPAYTHMGAAVAYDANGVPYYTQVFIKR